MNTIEQVKKVTETEASVGIRVYQYGELQFVGIAEKVDADADGAYVLVGLVNGPADKFYVCAQYTFEII